MDPNFVQHSVADISTRLFGVLVFLMGLSVVLWACLGVFFGTRWYARNFGKGLNGTPSRFFPGYDPRPWIAIVVGCYFAVGYNLNFIQYYLGVSDAAFAIAAGQYVPEGAIKIGPDMQDLGIVTGYIPVWLTVLLGNIATGFAIGGGPKVFIGAAKEFARARDAIAKAFDKRVNGAGSPPAA